MLIANTITEVVVYSGESSIDRNSLLDDINEWEKSDNKSGYYDPLTELIEGDCDDTYAPKSIIIDELIREIKQEFSSATGIEIEHVEHWVHVHHENMSTDTHNHFPYDVSAVYYVSVPEGSGPIVFLPSCNKYHPQRVPFTPKEGTFLMFPGILDHRVNRHQSKEPRISISFNFKINNQD